MCGSPLSTGASQKRVARGSEAIVPYDTASSERARTSLGHDMEATSWLLPGDRHWLWVMARAEVASCQSHPKRAKAACAQLMGAWRGVLVREGALV